MTDYIKIRTRTDECHNIAYTRNVRIVDEMPKLCGSLNGGDIIRIDEFRLTDPEQPTQSVYDYEFFEITTRDADSDTTTTLVAVLSETVRRSDLSGTADALICAGYNAAGIRHFRELADKRQSLSDRDEEVFDAICANMFDCVGWCVETATASEFEQIVECMEAAE